MSACVGVGMRMACVMGLCVCASVVVQALRNEHDMGLSGAVFVWIASCVFDWTWKPSAGSSRAALS